MINYHNAKMYGGTMIFRFDDTNPSNEKLEFLESIFEDLNTLGIKWDKHTHKSDHFVYLIEKARELIPKGKAYTDDTPMEEMKNKRAHKENSKYRNNTIEENLAKFNGLVKSK